MTKIIQFNQDSTEADDNAKSENGEITYIEASVPTEILEMHKDAYSEFHNYLKEIPTSDLMTLADQTNPRIDPDSLAKFLYYEAFTYIDSLVFLCLPSSEITSMDDNLKTIEQLEFLTSSRLVNLLSGGKLIQLNADIESLISNEQFSTFKQHLEANAATFTKDVRTFTQYYYKALNIREIILNRSSEKRES